MTSFVAIQENVVFDLTPASHDYDHQASASGLESNEDGPLGSTAHATIVRSKAQCRRQFESGLERYMNLVKSRGWAMYSADLLFAVRIEVTDSVTKKTSIGMCFRFSVCRLCHSVRQLKKGQRQYARLAGQSASLTIVMMFFGSGNVYLSQPACVRNARNDRLLGSG